MRIPSAVAVLILPCFLSCLVGCESATPVETVDASGPSTSTSDVDISQPLAEFTVATSVPSDADPVSFGMGVDPGSVQPGSLVTLAIRARLAEGWHIYAVDQPTEPNKPTQFELTLPAGFSEVGGWDIPEPHASDGIYYYEKEVVFRRFIRVAEDTAPGVYDIGCVVAHQTCTDSRCMRPTSKVVNVGLEVTE